MDNIKINKDKIIVSVHQPGYHRYIGYIYKIWLSDIFISFDTVQYVPREYQNRQIFYFDNETKWLTVPVNSGRDLILKKKIVDADVLKNHWKIISNIYKHSPYYDLYKDRFEELYHREWNLLADFCDELTKLFLNIIGINTIFVKASDFLLNEEHHKKAELLVNTIKAVINISDYKSVFYTPRAYPFPNDHYLFSKISGTDIQEIDIFRQNNIEVAPYLFKYPHYSQCFVGHPEFVYNLSTIDLIFNEGPNSLNILKNCG